MQDITNCSYKVSDEYKVIILLCDIPDVHKEVNNIIKNWKEALTPSIVIDSLKSKEREMKAERNERKIRVIHQMRDGSHSNSVRGKKVVKEEG